MSSGSGTEVQTAGGIFRMRTQGRLFAFVITVGQEQALGLLL